MTPILAIDPGASGGLAWHNADGEITLYAMPETSGDVCELLREIKANSGSLTVVIEQVGGYVKGNSAPGSAMFNFGMNYGIVQGILMAWSAPIELVTPQTWQRSLRIGTKGTATKTEWKNKLKAKAQLLYPAVHGRITNATADALLILHWKLERSTTTIHIA